MQRQCQRTALLNDMIVRQPAQNVPALWDTPGPAGAGLLASSFHGLLSDSDLAQNADKTQTKCRQNRKCDFFNACAPNTYNVSALTCLNFPIPKLNLNPAEADKVGRAVVSAPDSCQFVPIRGCHSKLTRTDHFRPKSPGTYYTNKPIYSPPMRVCSCTVTQLSTLNIDIMDPKTRPFPDRPRAEFPDFLRKSAKPDRDGVIFWLGQFPHGV